METETPTPDISILWEYYQDSEPSQYTGVVDDIERETETAHDESREEQTLETSTSPGETKTQPIVIIIQDEKISNTK